MNGQRLQRRDFLRIGIGAGITGTLLNAAEPNIRWGLGLVTWRGSAGWPQILADVEAAKFDGVEPFTAKFVNDQAMDELAQLLRDKYKSLKMSSIYWSGPFENPAEHDRLKNAAH